MNHDLRWVFCLKLNYSIKRSRIFFIKFFVFILLLRFSLLITFKKNEIHIIEKKQKKMIKIIKNFGFSNSNKKLLFKLKTIFLIIYTIEILN